LFVIAQFIHQLAGITQAVLIGLSDLVVYAFMVGLSQLSLGLIAWQLAPTWGMYGVAFGYLFSSIAILVLCNLRLSLRHGWLIPRTHWALAGYGLFGLALAGVLFRQSALNVTTMLLAVAYYFIFTLSLGLFFGRQELRQVLLRFSKALAL
jgi:hypothetical protein